MNAKFAIRAISILFSLTFLMTKLPSQQSIHPFTITDTEGVTHNVYTDHLNQGQTVVIKFFFTTCPPCIALAPWWQQRYVAWGSGEHDVEFFEISILGSDSNIKVKNYKNQYGMTMVAAGADGGAGSVTGPFIAGTYGSWWGTPSFAVIEPNGTLHYPVYTSELDDVIASTGAQMPGSIPDPTVVNLNISTPGGIVPDGDIKFYLKPQNADNPKIEIQKNGQGEYQFSYPSPTFPEMNNPIIVMESIGPAWNSKVSAADIVTIQKHILGLTVFQENYKILAADVDGNSKVTAADLVVIRKLILGFITNFPNGVPSYKSIPSQQSIISDPGQTAQINMSVFKMGHVN